MRVGVVGLGKLGATLAAFYASKGHDVTGADVSEERIRLIKRYDPEIDREPEVVPSLRAAEAQGRWRTTTSTAEAVHGADIVTIIVPVHATSASSIDFSMLDSAVEAVAAELGGGTLVIVETTVPTRTTRTRILPRFEARGLEHGRDFWLAYSPERVAVGTIFRDLRTYPRVVGGIDASAASRLIAFYQGLGLDTIAVNDTDTAEFVKLIEAAYRDVNIALANQFAQAADALGLDVSQAIHAANSQPQSSIHVPGVGVGGTCIPVYPYLYASSTPVGTELALAARSLNDGMAEYAVDRLERALGRPVRDARVLIMGVTYRRGVNETGNSSALLLRERLSAHGAWVFAADPLLSDQRLACLGFEPAHAPQYTPCDAVILQTAPVQGAPLDWIAATGCEVVLDGRNALDRAAVEAAGAKYVGVGR